MSLRMAPQANETADRPTAAAKFFDMLPGIFLVIRQCFRPFHEPFDEDAGLWITKPARQGVIVQDVAQEWFGHHQHLSPPPSARLRTRLQAQSYSKTG
jgi:hypothetical protein